MLSEHLQKLDTTEQEKSELAIRVSQMEQRCSEGETQVKLLEERLSEQTEVSVHRYYFIEFNQVIQSLTCLNDSYRS